MTVKSAILRDLTASQSTADALAERLRQPLQAVEIVLARMAAENLVASKPICDGNLTVWYLRTRSHP